MLRFPLVSHVQIYDWHAMKIHLKISPISLHATESKTHFHTPWDEVYVPSPRPTVRPHSWTEVDFFGGWREEVREEGILA